MKAIHPMTSYGFGTVEWISRFRERPRNYIVVIVQLNFIRGRRGRSSVAMVRGK